MKNINKSQGGPDIYRIRKLLKKTYIKTSRRNRNSYTTDKKEIKITMEIVEKENISTNQETNIVDVTDTTFRLESFTDHENRRLESHNRSRIIPKERIINVHVKKNDDNEIELRNHKKRNVSHYIRN